MEDQDNIDYKIAMLIYKQAILPLSEYAGFVLISCTVGQRQELLTLQNNALRLCKKKYLRDRHILGLEQRLEQHCRKQLLRLMSIHSKNDGNVQKIKIQLTRANRQIVLETASR